MLFYFSNAFLSPDQYELHNILGNQNCIQILQKVRLIACSRYQAESRSKERLFLLYCGMFTVYVLYSPSFYKIYIGYTPDINNRFLSHNELATKGYTIRYRPWEIAHTEEFDTKTEALKREKYLKSAQGRKFAWNIIHQKFGGSDG
ncbi:GIY-YIG nuclease family protein [Mucilaginibacter sp. X4EP1]|uniref:GIY-YIG nuclease family protein n=1 Tax=Mucilaginibacter sp. X4EP1 TaxID=2723092 RepID=UPI00216904C1|nr:GIY-YIG nuclease family protein [Mucilaginibacter sp. X4EP1]MCS3816557.1 putative endonuclease [Mucilaginibacter sp. X4EP1]